MNYTVKPGEVSGRTTVPASKSVAHRQLICSALSSEGGRLRCDGISKDIAATIRCLEAMGAVIENDTAGCISVKGIKRTECGEAALYCGESGSTLRFLMPVAGALGMSVVFHMEGLLPKRPHSALIEVLSQNGMQIRQEDDRMYCSGRLISGDYRIPGNISSQFISGLLFALPLLEGDSTITVLGESMSESYIGITLAALKEHGICTDYRNGVYYVPGKQKYAAVSETEVERDWSSAAFLLCMGALSRDGVTLTDMNMSSVQGDRKILDILRGFGAEVVCGGSSVTVRRGETVPQCIDARDIPDLVPTIAALACGINGTTTITGAERLRYKESDRLLTTSNMLNALGGTVQVNDDGLTVFGTGHLAGGSVDSARDHRIAMSAAVAACICSSDVIIGNADCVDKSFPGFYGVLETLKV